MARFIVDLRSGIHSIKSLIGNNTIITSKDTNFSLKEILLFETISAWLSSGIENDVFNSNWKAEVFDYLMDSNGGYLVDTDVDASELEEISCEISQLIESMPMKAPFVEPEFIHGHPIAPTVVAVEVIHPSSICVTTCP